MAGAKNKIDTSFLTQLDGYALPLRNRVTAVHSGSYISTKKGSGLDLVDHRKYNPGDPFKKIDWNLYARYRKTVYTQVRRRQKLEYGHFA